VAITSIIFLVIIAIIVLAYSSMLNAIKSNTEEMVYRIVAKTDIEPGTEITPDNVERVMMQNVLKAENMIYRLNQGDYHVESVEDANSGDETISTIKKEDGLWAVGKVANERIYKGEVLLAKKLILKEDKVGEETRLYAIPFDSSTTGAYNIDLGEKVDICLLYSGDERTISDYQNLPANKLIDIVLAGRQIADIRDESGNSRKNGVAVVPGYICFNLTYEEINKLEIAKRQGTLFIGSAENYYAEGAQAETFMPNAQLPNF